MKTIPQKRKKGRRAKHPNSHAREVVLQALYQIEVGTQPINEIIQFKWLNEELSKEKKDFAIRCIHGITDSWDAIEGAIRSFSHKHTSQISVVNRCVLSLGIYELMLGQLDARIIIDDALNLIRKYEGEESIAFINGILDKFEKERIDYQKKGEKNAE